MSLLSLRSRAIIETMKATVKLYHIRAYITTDLTSGSLRIIFTLIKNSEAECFGICKEIIAENYLAALIPASVPVYNTLPLR